MAKIKSLRNVFVRELNSEPLDIDVDLGRSLIGEERNTIIKYLESKYNHGNNTHVAFVGTRTVYSIKSALRDVGRTFEIPPSEIFAATKEIDESISLEENLKKSKLLKSFLEKYLEAFKIASQITGVTSNFGVHAGGVVISDVHYPLNKTLPLHRANNETPATIFDKDEIQDLVGLVKYDLLGVNALSQIAYTKYLLKDNDIYNDYAESKEPFSMCKSGHHKNIFQFESPLGKRTFKECKMESIMDLSNASGMIRQMGTADGRTMYDKYKKNSTLPRSEWELLLKNETSKKTYQVVLPILEKTYGILIYQEQLSEIIRDLSNNKYSFGEGNNVRKTLSKFVGKYGLIDSMQGKKEILKSWHNDILSILNKYIVPFLDEEDLSIEGVQDFLNFNLDEKNNLPLPKCGILNWFIIGSTYLFSIIHSVAYSIISYNQMYQKYYHPHEFWLGALNTGSKDDVNNYISSAQSESKIDFLNPDINLSQVLFTKENDKIRFGLGFIAGMDKAAEDILKERGRHPFKDFNDFLIRTKQYRSVNKKTIENLIHAGVFEEDIKTCYDLFTKGIGEISDWSEKAISKRKGEVLGVYLENKNIDTNDCTPIEELTDGMRALCSFKVLKATEKKTKNGKSYLLLSVMCSINRTKSNVFIWTLGARFEEGIVYKAPLKKNGDFLSLSL